MNTALSIISDNYPAWEGTKVLELLSHYPGEPIYASVMERCLNQGISPAEAQTRHYHLAPIRMTDTTTIAAVKKRLNRLISQKASLAVVAVSKPPFPGASESAATDDCAVVAVSKPPFPGASVVVAVSKPPFPGASESAATAIDTEINALTAYLKETTLPSGCIKCFGDDDTKAYRRIWAAISRLLKKAEADGHHEAVAIIKANLKQGKIFSLAG